MSSAVASLEAFSWSPQPEAERFVLDLVEDFLRRCPQAATLASRMTDESGTRFHDWIDAILLPDSDTIRRRIAEAGYTTYENRDGAQDHIFAQPKGIFPRIVLHEGSQTAIHLKVTSVADFAAVHQLSEKIEGVEWLYRRVRAFTGDNTELWASERWGWTGFELPEADPADSIEAGRWLESFRARRRDFADTAEGFAYTNSLLDACPLPTDQKCALFFEAERDYWQRRNRAAQVQKARQDRLGLGWGNHDHHTYRSSRGEFSSLIALFEKLGLVCRERFYAGRDAGWGAQVMEQPYTNIITFNDVDLSADELMGDFSHEGLTPRPALGTIGLWCALHGEALFQAGMHHLECQFDFDSLTEQLNSESGVRMMKPFTNFSYLRQAFTEGERWKVNEARIQRALDAGYITAEQAAEFRANGALGSHLENLERNEGFKGFNQTGVSEIIKATDPRKQGFIK